MSKQQDDNINDEELIDLNKKIAEAKEADEEQNEEIDQEDDLQAQLEKMTEMAKRTMADMQNLKRRQEEERVQTILRANAHLLKDLLPNVDTLRKALEHIPEGSEDWAKGIEMSINQMQSTFLNMGLSPIEAMGKPFDPDVHEALGQGPGEKDTVIEEMEKGYILGDMVIRHSKVMVGNGEK